MSENFAVKKGKKIGCAVAEERSGVLYGERVFRKTYRKLLRER